MALKPERTKTRKNQASTSNELERLFSLDVEWFQSVKAKNPEEKAHLYKKWLEKTHPKTPIKCIRESMRLATGLSPSAIGFYTSKTGNQLHKLSEETLFRLDELYKALGKDPRKRQQLDINAQFSPNRIMILTELCDLPSMSFHLDVIKGIIRSAKQLNVMCPLYEINPFNMDHELLDMTKQFKPHGAIFIRMNPSSGICRYFKKKNIPTILLHADRNEYSAPILANIIPNQDYLTDYVKMWGSTLKNIESINADSAKNNPIVIVAMRAENDSSIRSQRIKQIEKGLVEFETATVTVDNYQFYQAINVYQKYPDARAYFCLSDEIAVALKHLLIVAGKNPAGRIIGFDNLQVSEKEQVSSFGQDVNKMGSLALGKILEWHSNKMSWSSKLAEEIFIDIHLQLRK